MKKFYGILLLLLCILSVNVYADNINVSINGSNINFSNTEPQIINGRTMVPVRSVLENIGVDVSWNSDTKTVTAKNSDTTVQMKIGSKNLNINSFNQIMDCEPVIINGSTLIPARYAAESFGYKVDWDSSSRTVVITKGSFVKIHFVDVGQGDCTVITDNGHTMVIDAGENEYGETAVSYIKSLGIGSIDYVIATHPHSDHIGGLDDVINSFNVTNVIMPNVAATTKTYESLLTAVKNSNANVIEPVVGNTYNLGNSAFTILAPTSYSDELNNNSVGIKLEYGAESIVMAGDAETEAESDILKTGINIDADVLKVGHHGSNTSTSQSFLDSVSPEIAVICVGQGNSYGHPTEATLEKLKNIDLYRTDINGDILVTFTGNSINVAAKKGNTANETASAAAQTNTANISQTNSAADKSQTNSNNTNTLQNTSSAASQSATGTYILNTNSKKVHLPSCSSVSKMSSKNKESFTGDVSSLVSQGYTACKVCNPF